MQPAGFKPNTQPQTEIVHYSTLSSTDVAIKMISSALNYPDLTMMTHVYQTRPDPPFCLGYEGAGEVIWVGADASYDSGRGVHPPPALGDRVFVNTRLNTHCSRLATAAKNCTPIPAGMGYDEAAGYIQGVDSSYTGVISRLQVQEGEWVLITGATGAIGLAGVQIAKHCCSANVIALGSDTKVWWAVRTWEATAGCFFCFWLREANGGEGKCTYETFQGEYVRGHLWVVRGTQTSPRLGQLCSFILHLLFIR